LLDILVGLANLYDVTPDAAVKSAALAWIEEEADPKYRKEVCRRLEEPRSDVTSAVCPDVGAGNTNATEEESTCTAVRIAQ
jgi:hypothetical protein